MSCTRRALRTAALAALLAGCALGWAVAAEEREAHIRRAFERSGIDRMIASFPAMIDGQLAQRQGQMPPEQLASLGEGMKAAFAPAFIERIMVAVFTKAYDPARLDAVIAWTDSDLGKRLTELELGANTPAFQQALREFAGTLQTHPPAQSRVALMARLDQAATTTDATVAMIVSLTASMMHGISVMVPEQQRMTPAQLEQMREQMRQQLDAPLRNHVLVRSLYMYREVSDADLERYVAFLAGDTGRWFTTTVYSALQASMAQAGQQLAQHISERGPS